MNPRRRQQRQHIGPGVRRTSTANGRRGAAVVEAGIVLGVFLTLLLGSLDLMLMVLHDNTLSQAARRLARAAIVRGERAADFTQPWGPAPLVGTADEQSVQAEAIRDILIAMDPANVQIELSWPEGDNAMGSRVEVVVSMWHEPIVGTLFGVDPYLLSATSTMEIEH